MSSFVITFGIFSSFASGLPQDDFTLTSFADRMGVSIDSKSDSAFSKFEHPTSRYLKKNKTPNNFIGKTFYFDENCESPTHAFGSLVNYCFDLDGSNGRSSFLIKMNKKDHTIVQLEYEEYGCIDVPIRVIDIAAGIPEFTETSDYGDCLVDGDSRYYSLDYRTSRPSFDGNNGVLALVSDTTVTDNCDVDKFVDFNWYKSGECIAVKDGRGVKFNAAECDTTGEATFKLYTIRKYMYRIVCGF